MSGFVEYLQELFEVFGPVTVKGMFGGHGVFHQGLMIGLVADGELFLKVDAQTEPAFEELGLPHFTFDKNGKPTRMSYRMAPDEALEDPDVMAEWAAEAYGAAQRSKK